MKKTRVCDLLNISYPILQGGMLWLADAGLAAAVSNAGALGIISPFAEMERRGDGSQNLRRQLGKVRKLTRKRQEHVSFPQGSRLHDVAVWLNERYAISLPTPQIIAMLNGKVWDLYPQKWSTEIQEGDEICLFPPIIGG